MQRKYLNGAQLKNFAILCMFIDHVAACFLELAHTQSGASLAYAFPYGTSLDIAARLIGRSAFPIFCFMIVEGFLHTHDRTRYFLRLLAFAAVSQVPFQLAFYPGQKTAELNTMFSLALGMTAIWTIDLLKCRLLKKDLAKNKAAFIILTGIVTACFSAAAWQFHFDYTYICILCMVVLYLLYNRKDIALPGAWVLTGLMGLPELAGGFGFFLISRYNGTRGKQNKYFFYVFYPAHMLLLWLVRHLAFGY